MLRTRILTAVVAGLILLAVLFALPELLARAVIACLLLMGAWEWSGFFGAGNGGRYAFVALVAAMIAGLLAVSPDFRWKGGAYWLHWLPLSCAGNMRLPTE